MNIVEIRLITHTKLRNLHDDRISVFEQDIMEIHYEDNSVRKIAMFMQKDITDRDYYEIIPTKKTKIKILMHDDILDEEKYEDDE